MSFTDFKEVFNLQFVMFAEMAVGYVLITSKVIRPQDKRILSMLVLFVFLPANIINSFNTEFSIKLLVSFAEIFGMAVFTIVVAMILNRILWRKVPSEHLPVLQYATLCSNCGFLGNAVADSVYGPSGLMYCQIYLTPIRLFIWSIGLSYYAKGGGRKDMIKRVLTHPCIIATVIGIARMVLRIPFPEAINDTLASLGRCSTPAVMIFLGMIMGEEGFKGLISPLTLKYTFVRLILIPVIVMIPCVLLRFDPIVTGLSVLLAAMPAGSNTAVLAEQYNVDVEFAADCVVLTTILSILVLPLWVYIVNILA